METFEILWNSALKKLETTVSSISFSTFISRLHPVDIDGSKLILVADSKLFANHVAEHSDLIDKIKEALVGLNAGLTGFDLCVEENGVYTRVTGTEEERGFRSMPIDPKFTFESFVVGDSNRELYAAAKAVAKLPGDTYNPLFIYGGSGLGKTHIMHAIANYILATTPKTNVLYSTCENFTNEVVDNIMTRSSPRNKADFRKKYRNVDVLIVDDVQFLAGKKQTQEEFFNTFNELHAQGKQIILSADCPPQNIETLSDRLITRFSCGLTVQVSPPDLETKIAILEKKAAYKNSVLSREVSTYLAENSGSDDVRTLEGLLHKVLFASILQEKPITLELARNALAETAGPAQEALTTSNIIKAVCEYYHVSEKDLVGKKKNREIAEPRQVCVYLMTELMSIPLVNIGQAVGGRDHTTVIHARDKVSKLVAENGRFATEVNDLKNMILKK